MLTRQKKLLLLFVIVSIANKVQPHEILLKQFKIYHLLLSILSITTAKGGGLRVKPKGLKKFQMVDITSVTLL